jgi:hypothetical protein
MNQRFLPSLLALILVLAFAGPALAQARRRPPARVPAVRVAPRPAVRTSVVFGVGGFGYPRYSYFGPWYDPWYQYPYGPYQPYGYQRVYDEQTASIRLEVKPREAEVFVDGYIAGTVDDFDGFFQRLRVRPGQHELVLYLEGYRTVRQNLYLRTNSSQSIKYQMERLAAGESSGLRPVPQPPDEPAGPPEPRAPRPRPPARAGQQPPPPPSADSRYGTFSIRVQPASAEILVDGERWSAPAGQERLVIQLSEGTHKVEVRREGYETFSTEIRIRRGETNTLNVSLLRSLAGRF